jgi:hypothetical protein
MQGGLSIDVDIIPSASADELLPFGSQELAGLAKSKMGENVFQIVHGGSPLGV